MSYVTFENNIQTVILTSTVTRTGSTAFADATGLLLPMMASTSYEFECEVLYTSSGTNRNIGLGVNGPASPTSVLVHTEIMTSATAVLQGMQRAYDTGTAATSADVINVPQVARCYGFVTNGTTAGNLQLRFRVNNAGGTIILQPGTIMRMWRTAPSN